MKICLRTLQYIKGTADEWIFFSSRAHCEEECNRSFIDGVSELQEFMDVYSDSDWASSEAGKRKSRSGLHITLFGGSIEWRSKMQWPTALSSTEAEYYASIDACKAGLHIQIILYELQFGKIAADDHVRPLKVFLDNQSTIHQR